MRTLPPRSTVKHITRTHASTEPQLSYIHSHAHNQDKVSEQRYGASWQVIAVVVVLSHGRRFAQFVVPAHISATTASASAKVQ